MEARDLQRLVLACEDNYLRELAKYAVAEGREIEAVACGARNLFGTSLEEWQAELAALLHRSPNPAGVIDHWVFSWPEGEQPTVDEAEGVIGIFLKCQGLANAPVVWGYHADTDNAHIHLQVVRLDRQTGQRLTAGDGWDIDTAHRAKAVIEAAFPHWTSEKGSLYEVREGILIERASDLVIGKADDPANWQRRRNKSDPARSQAKADRNQIDAEAIANEEATGFMSRTRVALEIAVPIVLAAPTLDAAHAALAEQGIELRRKGSGAVFMIDGKPIKASVDRRTSLAALKKQFGTHLTPCPYAVSSPGPRERWPNDARRRQYFELRRGHEEGLRAAANDARSALGGRARDQSIATAIKAAIHGAAFPSFEAWTGGAAAPDPASVIFGAMGISTISVEPKMPRVNIPAVNGFVGTRLGNRTVYRAAGQRVGPPAFVDIGHKVLVYSSTDRAAVRASLLLIAARYPNNKVAVTGGRNFQKLVLDLAQEEGIALDGKLGQRQAAASVAADRNRTPTNSPSAPPISVQRARLASPVQATSAVPSQMRRRLSAMVARLFHSVDWAAGDYWSTKQDASGFMANLPPTVRSMGELPGLPGERDAEAARKAAIERARYAASVAAASLAR